MAQRPLQFYSILCRHCNAIMALIPPGTFIRTTYLRCPHCGVVRTIRTADSSDTMPWCA